MKVIFRQVIPVDGQPHAVKMSLSGKGAPLCVASQEPDQVEFWHQFFPDEPAVLRYFQVYGTGQPIPNEAYYCGTAPRNERGLVWHLFERTS